MKLKDLFEEDSIEEKAGFIPYFINGDRVEMLFMVPSNSKFGGSRFQISKGHVEDNEATVDGALREANEELGLRDRNIISVFKGWTGKLRGVEDNYKFTVFAGQVKDKTDFGDHDFETRKTGWLTLDEFRQRGRSSQLEIVSKIVKEIQHRI